MVADDQTAPVTPPRTRLHRAWRRLTEQGAVVHRPPRLGRLSPSEMGALAEREERRLRALAEGRAAGWCPPVSDTQSV